VNKHEEEFIAAMVDRISEQQAYALAQLERQLAQSFNGVLLKGASYAALPAAGIALGQGGDLMLARSPGCIVGLGLKELSGNLLNVNLHDGYDASAPVIAALRFNANVSITGPLSSNPGGVFFSTALFIEVAAGTGVLGGAVYLRGTD